MENVNPEQKFINFPRTPLKKEFQGESLENYQEKQILIDNLNIKYKIIGDGNIPIILLHGWGVSSDKYIETIKQLNAQSSEFKFYALDLPGFGKSDNPPSAWGVDEYSEFVKKFIQSIDSKGSPWIMIGHSFGGQIAIKFAAKYPEKLKTLILTGAAGIRHSATVKQKIFYYLAKIGKVIFSLPLINKLEKSAQKILYKAAREKDYYAAQGVMKEVFKKVLKEDLKNFLNKIQTPTLLVWGAKDNSTPLADGRLISLKIGNCKLKIVFEANHSLPYRFPEKFAKIVIEFIKN